MTVRVITSSDRTRLTGQLQLLQIQPSASQRCGGLNCFPRLPRRFTTTHNRRSRPMVLHFTGRRAITSWLAALSLAACTSRPTPSPIPTSEGDRPPVTAVDSTVHASNSALDIYQAG